MPAGTDAVVIARHGARELAEREGLSGIQRALGELIDKVPGVEAPLPGREAGHVSAGLRWLFVLPIRAYQLLLSPLVGQRCKYYPSCSEYAVQAVQRFGILRGLVLAGWRLLRCNPWSSGGYDPVEEQRLFKVPTSCELLTMLVTANIFQPLIDVFEAVLKFFHNSVGIPWGWSIVLLTIVVRAAMIPLTLKQIKSMVRLQALSPQMKEIQAKYKEDKQRQQQEIMKLYKEHGVNPFGSCLPLVAQLPVFVSLYYMLRQSLRADICPTVQPGYSATLHKVVSTAHTKVCGGHNASFLFIHDLTDKATGATLVALLILYVGTQLASTIMMSASQTDPNMRRVMMFMPLVFVLVVISFPAGVLVYWITTNTWTIGQQYIVKRRMGPLQAATAAGAPHPAAGRPAPERRAAPSSGDGGRTGGGRSRPEKAPSGKAGAGKAATAGNGSASGGLGAMIRNKVRPDEKPATVATAQRTGPPPKPPRKKKKRSGRRR